MKVLSRVAGVAGVVLGMTLCGSVAQTPAQPAAAAPVLQQPAADQGPGYGGRRQRGRNRELGRVQGGVGPGFVGTSGTGYGAYQLVQMRNMFDPNRYPNSMAAQRVAPVRTDSPPPRATDYVALTGVMVTGDNELAFFSGSRPDYDRVLQLNGEVAGATVTKITLTNIEVDRDGKKIVVGLGQTVPFDANSAPGVPPANSASSGGGIGGFGFGGQGAGPGAGGDTQGSPAAPTISSSLSDVMRRMMERRQQQLK
jgi:hypothetical protein